MHEPYVHVTHTTGETEKSAAWADPTKVDMRLRVKMDKYAVTRTRARAHWHFVLRGVVVGWLSEVKNTTCTNRVDSSESGREILSSFLLSIWGSVPPGVCSPGTIPFLMMLAPAGLVYQIPCCLWTKTQVCKCIHCPLGTPYMTEYLISTPYSVRARSNVKQACQNGARDWTMLCLVCSGSVSRPPLSEISP